MEKHETHVVIMAGGIGSRLWPLSTPETPKQFIDVLGTGKSLLQMTVERFLPVCDITNFWVVTSVRYVPMVAQQVPGIPKEQILAEPEARNTAPCIAYATYTLLKRNPQATMVVTPADHIIMDKDIFAEDILAALEYSSDKDVLTTVGMTPTRPDPNYG